MDFALDHKRLSNYNINEMILASIVTLARGESRDYYKEFFTVASIMPTKLTRRACNIPGRKIDTKNDYEN